MFAQTETSCIVNRIQSDNLYDNAHATEDIIFDMLCESDNSTISLSKFIQALGHHGLRSSDPRLKEMATNLGLTDHDLVTKVTFKNIILPNIGTISRAFQHKFIIPDFPAFTTHLKAIFSKCQKIQKGNVATYIPELREVNPDFWGCSVCTIDGQRHSQGDSNVPFTIQSCCKPLVYALALDKLGATIVHQFVGQEPSGRNFNAMELDSHNKPFNPMVNAGAIALCSLLLNKIHYEMDMNNKIAYLVQHIRKMTAGEYVGFNNKVFESEKESGYRNYALAYFLKEQNCFPDNTNVETCLELYFRTCSIEATCDSMAVLAATLANGGICPLTEEKVFRPSSTRDVLSLMHSCGMYDYSGQFAFKVGLPAKSGISGCMILVIPGVLGVALWSPQIDSLGNSCRSIHFCELLLQEYNFHPYENVGHAAIKMKNPRENVHEGGDTSVINLLFYTFRGDLSALRRHYMTGHDMSLTDYDNRTAMHLAAVQGHLDCVRFLVERCRLRTDSVDRWGHTPIDDARLAGHEDVEDYLRQYQS